MSGPPTQLQAAVIIAWMTYDTTWHPKGTAIYPRADSKKKPVKVCATAEEAGSQCVQMNADAVVRAVVEAMREPSEGMVGAGYDAGGRSYREPVELDDAWRAMLEQWAKEQGVGDGAS